MSLGIAFKGPEGIVLAADSRVTLTTILQQDGQQMLLPSTYDNATKLLRINGQPFVGVVTYGLGAIGPQEQRTAHSLIPEFESEALKGKSRLKVCDFSAELSRFFMQQWADRGMPRAEQWTGPDMLFLVAGYDEGEAYGHVFEILIPRRPPPNELHPGAFGIVWGGQREIADRIVQGFDERLPGLVQQQLGLTNEQRDGLKEALKSNLTLSIPYAFLPLQDCVDLAIFIVRATMTLQTKLVGVRGVGGSIDVATVTRMEGFKPIQEKHIAGEQPLS